jgi:hypothetical protein
MCQHEFHKITFDDQHCTSVRGHKLPKTVFRCLICLSETPLIEGSALTPSVTYTKEMGLAAIERGFL